jgi:DNA-binding SARP family transcriptional activator
VPDAPRKTIAEGSQRVCRECDTRRDATRTALRLDFRILGPLEVRAQDTPLPLGGAKQRTVLAVLLLDAGVVVSRDQLIDALWGEAPPPTAGHTLDAYVSRLRKVLGDDPGRLLTRAPGYMLRVEPGALDLDRFEQLLAAGRAALHERRFGAAADTLREADELWRGPPLADLALEPFAQAPVQRLVELRMAAIEDRVDAELALGRHGALASELRAMVAEHPLRERLRGQLMLALYRAGRQADALEAFRSGRMLLVEELGLEPGPALRALEQAILTHDPALDTPQPATAITVAPHKRRGRIGVAAAVLAVAVAGTLVAVLRPSAAHAPNDGGSSDTPRSDKAKVSVASAQLPGGRIAFRRFLDDAHTHGALFVVNPDGTGERQLTRPAAGTVDDQPEWSPDGRHIAFERCAVGDPCSVWTVRPDGSEAHRVHVRCTLRPICEPTSPSWTPDGRLVVGLAQGRNREHGTADQIQRFSIELVDRRHALQRTIFARDHWTGDTAQPVISPDGKTIVFKAENSWLSKPRLAQALYAVDADGTHRRRLTPWRLGAGDHPAFAPDGKRVIFRSHEDQGAEQSDYWTVAPNGRHLAELTHFKGGRMALSTSYSSDGKWIAVASDGVAGQADLFAMRADGSDMVRITKTAAWESAPDWGPPNR